VAESYSTSKQFSLHSFTISTSQSNSNGVWTPLHTNQSSVTYNVRSNTRSGVRNPQWRDQVKLGTNATTPFSGVDARINKLVPLSVVTIGVMQAGDVAATQSGVSYSISGFPAYTSIFTPNADSSVQTRVINRCISKFLDACDEARSSIEAGQDIGEYRETLESIHRPLGSMQDKLRVYLNQLTKASRSIKRGPALRKVIADTYLEFRFGINPLVDDVAKIIADCGRFRFPVIPVHAAAHERYQGSASITTLGNMGDYPSNQIGIRSYSEFYCRYKGAYRSNSNEKTGKIGVLQSLRLLPEDFIPTVWDLLPYSWMVDYFTNVGDVYRGLCFVTSNLVWSCKTTRDRNVYSYSNFRPVTLTLSPGFHWVSVNNQCSGGEAEFEVRVVNRSALSAADLIPRFQIQIPQSKYPYLNMLAVASQKFRALSRVFTR